MPPPWPIPNRSWAHTRVSRRSESSGTCNTFARLREPNRRKTQHHGKIRYYQFWLSLSARSIPHRIFIHKPGKTLKPHNRMNFWEGTPISIIIVFFSRTQLCDLAGKFPKFALTKKTHHLPHIFTVKVHRSRKKDPSVPSIVILSPNETAGTGTAAGSEIRTLTHTLLGFCVTSVPTEHGNEKRWTFDPFSLPRSLFPRERVPTMRRERIFHGEHERYRRIAIFWTESVENQVGMRSQQESFSE